MNEFIKFKNVLRELRQCYERKIVLINEDIATINDILSNWDEIKIREEVKKRSLYLIFLKTFFPKIYKEAHRQVLLDNLNFLINQRDHLIKIRNLIRETISTFDNEKSIKTTTDPAFLFHLINQTVRKGILSSSEGIHIFGSAAYFNASHVKKVNMSENESQSIFLEVSSYFNKYGNFSPDGKNEQDFQALLTKLAGLPNDFISFENNDQMTVPATDFISEATMEYSSFKKSYIPPQDNKTPVLESPRNYNYIKEFKKYYKNGELLMVPSDIKGFQELLNNAEVPEDEQRKIYKKIYAALKEEKLSLQSRFTEKEETLYQEAIALLNSLEQFSEEAKSIRECLFKLTYSQIFGKQQTVSEIFTELEAIIEDCQLEETPKNNLIFLKDSDGETYFNKDLNDLDKGIRHYAIRILSKITPAKKQKFRRVYATNNPNIEMYELYNSKAHVIFIEIYQGIYLILGASTVGKNYDDITKRYFSFKNQNHIEDIIAAVNNVNLQNTILQENALLIPSGEGRKRKESSNA